MRCGTQRRHRPAELNRWFEQALERHPPPLVDGPAVEAALHHAGQGAAADIRGVRHAGRTVPEDYQRYLVNSLRETFDLPGTPIRLQLRGTETRTRNSRRRRIATPALSLDAELHPAGAVASQVGSFYADPPQGNAHFVITRILPDYALAGCTTPWVVLAVMFVSMLAGVGVRAAPGVMIVPLQHAFGWDVATISGAVSINIILLGATGPFLTGLIDFIGIKRTILGCMTILMAATGLSIFMTQPWELFLTWGLMVGIGSGGGAVGMAAAVANRWFAKRTALAMGLLTAANAAGQLIFLPLLAMLANRYGWQGVAIGVTIAMAASLPLLAIMLPESPASVGLGAYGSTNLLAGAATARQSVLGSVHCLRPRRRSLDFWLLGPASVFAGFPPTG